MEDYEQLKLNDYYIEARHTYTIAEGQLFSKLWMQHQLWLYGDKSFGYYGIGRFPINVTL